MDSKQLDGLIVLTSCAEGDAFGQHLANRARVVLIDEDASIEGVPKVFVENHKGGYLATQHLLSHGHTRIAHICGPKGLFSAKERFGGYATALAEHGLEVAPDLVQFGLYTEAFGYTATQKLRELPQPPSAIFAASDYAALGVLRCLNEHYLHVPNDMSLVGFDDIPLARLLQPPLTTIKQPIDRLGREGIDLLVEMITTGKTTRPLVQRFSVELVERGSVKPLDAARRELERKQDESFTRRGILDDA